MDVSGHQTSAEVTAALVGDEVQFTIVKATEGKGFFSDAFDPYRKLAHDDGQIVGAYHFAWPNQDPALEAANFLTRVKPRIGELVALDLENWGTGKHPTPEMNETSWTERVAYALEWLRIVSKATGTKPLVYANWYWTQQLRAAATVTEWVELASYPWWIAEPSAPGDHEPVDPKPGTTAAPRVLVHQYTADRNGPEPGEMDGNWTPDLRALKACAVTKEAA